jgi:predicted DNA-binding protein
MKSSLAKKTSITLPAALEEELKSQADAEHRTLSGILQEAARYYLNIKKWESLQADLAPKARTLGLRNEKDVERLIHGLRR